LPRVVTQPRPGRGSNPRPLGRKSDAVPLRHHATRGPRVPGKILTSCRNSDSERPHSCCHHLANKVYIRPIGRKPQIRALRLTCARYQVFVCMYVCMHVSRAFPVLHNKSERCPQDCFFSRGIQGLQAPTQFMVPWAVAQFVSETASRSVRPCWHSSRMPVSVSDDSTLSE